MNIDRKERNICSDPMQSADSRRMFVFSSRHRDWSASDLSFTTR